MKRYFVLFGLLLCSLLSAADTINGWNNPLTGSGVIGSSPTAWYGSGFTGTISESNLTFSFSSNVTLGKDTTLAIVLYGPEFVTFTQTGESPSSTVFSYGSSLVTPSQSGLWLTFNAGTSWTTGQVFSYDLYAAPVPEPASFMLMGSGLLFTLRLLKARNAKA